MATVFAAQAHGGSVLFHPGQHLHPGYDSGYPRVIELHHAGAADGNLLATFSLTKPHPQQSDFSVYRSTDKGRTWSKEPVAVIHATRSDWDIDAPTLFELPRAEGDLPAGTLLAAGTAWKRKDFTRQTIEVFASTDHGLSWVHRSNCASESHMANTMGHGIWEPEFAIAGDGSLVCYFSDERSSVKGFNQVLAHKVSDDGGRTWGREAYDVAIHDDDQRPGMVTVLKLPNGRYGMTFEDCRKSKDPDTACSVYFKTSADGLDWSPAASLGSRVETSSGRHFLHTPYLMWSPAGGADGTLVVSGQRVVTGTDGNIIVQPESGRVLMINRHLGRGPWQEVAAPLVVDPTGGYHKDETGCPGYSSPMLDMGKGDYFYMAGTAIPGTHGLCEIRYGSGRLKGGMAP